jgi:NAD(P)-dependent dehydrogenase (short-subunit alcohol dehydrogenase family)
MSDSWRAVVLVNNAGVLENARVATREWVERSLATNLLAPFLLTRRLAPRLAESAPSRVVKAHVGVLGCLLRRFGRSGGCGLLDEFLSTLPVIASFATLAALLLALSWLIHREMHRLVDASTSASTTTG